MSTGAFHTCALTSAGIGYCWGANYSGQLGIGAADNALHTTPVPVSGGLTFVAISAGVAHSCGVSTGGTIYCWGSNTQGQLGNSSVDVVPHPAPEAVVTGISFASVSAGLTHTCALSTSGAAYCWGSNALGELGIGVADTVLRATPVAVGGGLVFASISVGGDHACGITFAGAAWCWGGNGYGGIGDGTMANSRPSPVAVTGGLAFAGVSAAGDYLEGDLNGGHSCGVTLAGAAYCWGLLAKASPAAVTGGLSFARVSTFDDISGEYHMCALTPAGAAYCWGANYDGALGDGTETYRADPAAVTGGLTFAAISAGGDHTCGVTTSGIGYCWGRNLEGELGNGSNAPSSSPVRVAGQP